MENTLRALFSQHILLCFSTVGTTKFKSCVLVVPTVSGTKEAREGLPVIPLIDRNDDGVFTA